MTINQKLTEPFPQQALKTRQGGGGKVHSVIENRVRTRKMVQWEGYN